MPTLNFAQKLSLTMASMILLAVILIGYPMVYRLLVMLEEQFDTLGSTFAQQVATSAVEPIFVNSTFEIERVISNFIEQPQVAAVVIVNRDFQVFGTAYPRPDANTLSNTLYFSAPGQLSAPQSISWFYHPIRFADVTGGLAWVGLDKKPLLNNEKLIISSSLFGVLLIVSIVIWLTIRISRSFSRPINEIIAAFKEIDQGNYDHQIPGTFSGEFNNVKTAFNKMALSLREKLNIEKNISRFVSPPVANYYMSKEESELTMQGRRVQASIMYIDLVGYTNFSKQHSPETVAQTLNFYFSEFSTTCHRFKGNVDKFIGDCAMLVFGCPYNDDQHNRHALECALFIRDRIRAVNAEREKANEPWMNIRIGLAGGTVLAGLLGCSERLNYSVIGDAANLAARLCDQAPVGEILIDREFLYSLGQHDDLQTQETQQINVKGFSLPVSTLVVEQMVDSNKQ